MVTLERERRHDARRFRHFVDEFAERLNVLRIHLFVKGDLQQLQTETLIPESQSLLLQPRLRAHQISLLSKVQQVR